MAERPTHAMILAAGLGQRMRPLTALLPKPLVPVLERPLIDRILARLADFGITHVAVNVHHLASQIEAHLTSHAPPGVRIAISDERAALLDSGGGVRKALPFLADRPFIVHNCDSIWLDGVGSNLARLSKAWDEGTMDCLLLLAPTTTSIGYAGRGDFAIDAVGRLRRPAPGEIVPFAFAGVSIAHPRLLDGLPDGPFSLNVAWNRSIRAARAFGVRMEGVWMHIGDPVALAEAESRLMAADED